MALFNAYLNGRYNNESENPTIASEGPADATGGGTLRQSTIGLLFDGPQTVFGRQGKRIALHGLFRRLDLVAESPGPAANSGH